jgi:O-antigen/teichoic acid export membrane protein
MFWNVAMFPLKFAVGFAAGLVVPNLLGLERYGLYILITSVAATLGNYVDLGIERALPRYIPEVAHRFGARGLRRFLREVFGVKLGLLLVLVLVLNLFSGPLIGMMRNGEVENLESARASLQQETDPEKQAELQEDAAAHEALIQRLDVEGRLYLAAISIMLVMGAIYDVCVRLLVAYFRQRASNTIDLAVATLQPGLIITFFLLGWDVKGVLLALVVTPIVAVLLAWWRMSRAVAVLPDTGAEVYTHIRQLWPRFLAFSGVSYLLNLSTWLYDLAFLSLITAAYLSTRDVGTLGVASKFVSLFLTYLMVPLTGTQIPLFSHLYARKGRGDVQVAFSVLSQFLLLLLVPTGAGLALLSSSLVPLFYPAFPPETSTLVLVFICAMFLETIIGTTQQILLVYERYGVIVLARLSALVIVPLLLVLVPPYGLLGAAIAAGVARVLSRAITFAYGLRYFPLRFPWRCAGQVLAGTVVMLAALYPIMYVWGTAQVGAGWAGKAAALGKDLVLTLAGAVIFWAVFKALGGLGEEAKKSLAGLRFPLKKVLLRLL